MNFLNTENNRTYEEYESIENFLNTFAVFHKISYDEILREWQIWRNNKVVESEKVSKKETEYKSFEDTTCSYIFTKGPRKNKTCGNKIVNGCKYCKKHANCEECGQKIKKSMTNPTNVQLRGKIKNEEKKPLYIIKHRTKDFFWHPESKFVFDKITRHVIGVYSDEKILSLNDQDRLICKSYGFKIQT